MIFAAGLGTRLRPLTASTPKALIEVAGRPLLEWNIRRLIGFGYTDIVINVHYLADAIEYFVAKKDNFGINIVFSDERDLLLDTGGGLKKAARFLANGTPNEPILVVNADILTYLNLGEMRHYYLKNRPQIDALLAVQQRTSSRRLLFDADKNRLCGWENTATQQIKWAIAPPSEAIIHSWAFSGVQLISPTLLQQIPLDGIFSMIDLYLKMAPNMVIAPYLHSNDWWADIGKPENIDVAAAYLNSIPYF